MLFQETQYLMENLFNKVYYTIEYEYESHFKGDTLNVSYEGHIKDNPKDAIDSMLKTGYGERLTKKEYDKLSKEKYSLSKIKHLKGSTYKIINREINTMTNLMKKYNSSFKYDDTYIALNPSEISKIKAIVNKYKIKKALKFENNDDHLYYYSLYDYYDNPRKQMGIDGCEDFYNQLEQLTAELNSSINNYKFSCDGGDWDEGFIEIRLK